MAATTAIIIIIVIINTSLIIPVRTMSRMLLLGALASSCRGTSTCPGAGLAQRPSLLPLLALSPSSPSLFLSLCPSLLMAVMSTLAPGCFICLLYSPAFDLELQ